MNDKKNRLLIFSGRLVFYSSIIILVFCLFTPIFIESTAYEFVDDGDWFEMFFLFALPISIFTGVMGWLFQVKAKTRKWRLLLAISSFIMSFIVFVFIAFTLVFDFCSTDYYIRFESKKDSSIQILERSFGCGAVDSSPASISHVKAKKYAIGIMYLTKIDVDEIDKKDWIPK